MAGGFLLYGSYGYTGRLILELSLEKGVRPVLGGRNRDALAEQARPHGLEYRAFDVRNPAGVARELAGFGAVLNCAGPFHRTAAPMVQACLQAGVHYLDITGEIAVFEALAQQDAAARTAKVMLLPGVGFDVVPSDCLAAHLKSRLPDATELVLAFRGMGGASRGTAMTAVESMAIGAVRRNGRIVRVPPAWKTREVDFGAGPVSAATVPWGDVATAYYSTGIGNIEVYSALPRAAIARLRRARYLAWLLSAGPVQAYLKRRIHERPAGPSAERRAQSESHFWGEVRNPAGRSASARLRAPNGYTLTAMTALRATERALAREVKPGFQTPALVFGKDFILEFEGVSREDVE